MIRFRLRRAMIVIPMAALCVIGSLAAVAQTRSDFDGNGIVDFGDFLRFAAAFGTQDAVHDLDGDGSVSYPDFLLFAQDFGAGPKRPHWVHHAEVTGPTGRRDHTLTLDPRRNRLVLFGGKAEAVKGDTWILDLRSLAWRSVSTARSPGGRRGHTAVLDPDRDRLLIFGGETDNGFLNDVWAFDLATETWSFLSVSGDKPLTRYGLGAVFDRSADRMVVSHGFSSDGRYDDTWAFDPSGQKWSEITPAGNSLPQARCLHAMTIDDDSEHAYLYGGCSSGIGPCPRGDFWSYDLAARRWEEIPATANHPGDRGNPSLSYDSVTSRVILFAGADVRGSQDAWSYSSDAGWQMLEPTGVLPPIRWSHAAVFDDRRNRLLMFGGTDGSTWLGDLWELKF